jgi:hypothetical protein
MYIILASCIQFLQKKDLKRENHQQKRRDKKRYICGVVIMVSAIASDVQTVEKTY